VDEASGKPLHPLEKAQPANTDGRRALLTFIEELFERAVAGMSTVIFLAGEPGIGKTWLLDRVSDVCADRGATVLRGGAVDAEGMPPYLVFLEALGTYIRQTSADTLRTQAGIGARTLATILPELELKVVDLPTGMDLPPEQARLRLYDAMSEFLLAIAAATPLVLVMDDLQWADSATLQLLVHLARRARHAPLLFLGAYRPGEAAEIPAFQRTVAELTRQRLLVGRELAPLTAHEITGLAEDQLRGRVRAEIGDHLAEMSEGNPFVAEELLRTWVETGDLICHGKGLAPRSVSSPRPFPWSAGNASAADRTPGRRHDRDSSSGGHRRSCLRGFTPCNGHESPSRRGRTTGSGGRNGPPRS
jgi:predicted ATPase